MYQVIIKHSVYPPLSAGGGGGGGGGPPTKFSKRGAWQDLKFERGVAGRGG